MIKNDIKKRIKDAGYSCKFIAEQKLNIHHTELSNICAGRRTPTRKTLSKLSRILRCKITDLWEERS
mgnify:FL=1|tara:strand:- start:4746 stop:4946 length:201 start_codon:yes stop_codon:yes gene_type:complete